MTPDELKSVAAELFTLLRKEFNAELRRQNQAFVKQLARHIRKEAEEAEDDEYQMITSEALHGLAASLERGEFNGGVHR